MCCLAWNPGTSACLGAARAVASASRCASPPSPRLHFDLLPIATDAHVWGRGPTRGWRGRTAGGCRIYRAFRSARRAWWRCRASGAFFLFYSPVSLPVAGARGRGVASGAAASPVSAGGGGLRALDRRLPRLPSSAVGVQHSLPLSRSASGSWPRRGRPYRPPAARASATSPWATCPSSTPRPFGPASPSTCGLRWGVS